MKVYWMVLVVMMFVAVVSGAEVDVSVTIQEPGEIVEEEVVVGEFEELALDVKESGENAEGSGGISGQAVSFDEGQRIRFRNFIPIAFIIFIVAAKIYVVRKNRKVWGK